MPRSSPTATISEHRSFSPSNDVATYRDLLLFEERLKTNAANLGRRKSRYQLFLAQLSLFIIMLLSDVFLYTSFLVMPVNFVLQRSTPKYEPIIPHPYFTSALLLIAVTTLILFFASGMYNEKIGYANRYVPHANRALRSFNLYLNVRTQPHRSKLNPLSYLFSLGRTEDSTPETQTQVPRASSPRRGPTIPNIPPTNNPRGEMIFSSRVDPSFREGYERYRAAFERKREEQRRFVQSQKVWFQWLPWQRQPSRTQTQIQATTRIQLHPSPGQTDVNNSSARILPSRSPTPDGAKSIGARRRHHSKSPPSSIDSLDVNPNS